MTETTTEAKSEKQARHTYPDRFMVGPPGLEKIARLLGQLRAVVPACDATRKDILGWMIEKAPDVLGAADIKELSDRFYSEERFLRLALEEVRAAKARGERLSLDDILKRKPQAVLVPERKTRRRRKATLSLSDSPEEVQIVQEASDYLTTSEPAGDAVGLS
jgi:hypothetical protein